MLLFVFLSLSSCVIDGGPYPGYEEEDAEEKIKEALIEDSKQQIISKIGEENFRKFVRFGMNSASEGLTQIDYYLDLKLAGIEAPEQETHLPMAVYYKNGQFDFTLNVPDCVTHPKYCPPFNLTYQTAVEKFQKECSSKNFTLKPLTENENYYTSVLFSFDERKEQWLWWISEHDCEHRRCFPAWTVKVDPQNGSLYDESHVC